MAAYISGEDSLVDLERNRIRYKPFELNNVLKLSTCDSEIPLNNSLSEFDRVSIPGSILELVRFWCKVNTVRELNWLSIS
mmetsp:Transcript_5696/g.5895  ORF Transcript_5696/g.5895 Transcript_5696/m.5895 type:complete len:80 (-) Transcript_5696:363-602(-)